MKICDESGNPLAYQLRIYLRGNQAFNLLRHAEKERLLARIAEINELLEVAK